MECCGSVVGVRGVGSVGVGFVNEKIKKEVEVVFARRVVWRAGSREVGPWGRGWTRGSRVEGLYIGRHGVAIHRREDDT